MASLYSTKVTVSGGRHGSIRSEDGLLELKLACRGPFAERAMQPIQNNSLLAAVQPALRTQSFMPARMSATALPMTISTSQPGSTSVEKGSRRFILKMKV
jgi:hypothetical protein